MDHKASLISGEMLNHSVLGRVQFSAECRKREVQEGDTQSIFVQTEQGIIQVPLTTVQRPTKGGWMIRLRPSLVS